MKSRQYLFALALFFVTAFLFFHPVFFRGYLPFPGDLLVGHYAPWNTYSFLGYAPGGVPHKAQGIDVVRELFPWKRFSIEMVKKGELPLWNPHNFSGNPHLANFQTGVFYPLNFIFFILPFNLAWSVFIVLQPLLACIFMFLFLKEVKIGWAGAYFGSVVFAYCLLSAVWMEYGNIGHAFLWLPLCLFLVEKIIRKPEVKWVLFLVLSLTSSVLAGYIQLTIYLYGVVTVYFLYRLIFSGKQKEMLKKTITVLTAQAAALLLGLVQVLPTLEMLKQSAREAYPIEKIPELLLPWFYPVTVFASDFFGNPASRNYWLPGTYIERVSYFGVLPLFFALWVIFRKKKENLVWFFAGLAMISLLLTLNLWPIRFFYSLNIPIISTTVYTRLLSVFSFSGAVLAGFGLDHWLRRKQKEKTLKPVVIFGAVYLFLWLFTFLASGVFSSAWWIEFLLIARRNLILPTGIVIVFSGLTLVYWRFTRLSENNIFVIRSLELLFPSVILFLTIFDLFYYFQKITPFSPSEFVYPKTAVMEFLATEGGINRFWGYGTAYIDTNFSTYNHTYSPEGNDPLYIRRFGELMAAAGNRGIIPSQIPRADALLEKGFGREEMRENLLRQRLLDLLGVKYIFHKDENLGEKWQPDFNIFPENIYQLAWQQSPWQIYDNRQALPRMFLLDDFEVIKDDQAIISRIFSKDFDLSKTIIFEEDPKLSVRRAKILFTNGEKEEENLKKNISVINYSPNRVELEAETNRPAFLFLSDNYYPGWRVRVDGRETKILRADYTFRAVVVPEGKHQVVFSYQPDSLRRGAVVSGVMLVGVAMTGFLSLVKKKR